MSEFQDNEQPLSQQAMDRIEESYPRSVTSLDRVLQARGSSLSAEYVKFSNQNLTGVGVVGRTPNPVGGITVLDGATDKTHPQTVQVAHLATSYQYIVQASPGVANHGLYPEDATNKILQRLPTGEGLTQLQRSLAGREVTITVAIPPAVYSRPAALVGGKIVPLRLSADGSKATITIPAEGLLGSPALLAVANGNISGPAANFNVTITSSK